MKCSNRYHQGKFPANGFLVMVVCEHRFIFYLLAYIGRQKRAVLVIFAIPYQMSANAIELKIVIRRLLIKTNKELNTTVFIYRRIQGVIYRPYCFFLYKILYEHGIV